MTCATAPTPNAKTTMRRLATGAALAAAALLGFGALAAAPASADFGIEAFDVATLDPGANAFTQAGGHPAEIVTSFDLETETNDEGIVVPKGGTLRSADVDLPPGLVGNPSVVDTCTVEQLFALHEFALTEPVCPIDSIVGFVVVRIPESQGGTTLASPLFAMDPPPGVPAQFGFANIGTMTFLQAEVRDDGTYGISVRGRALPDTVTVLGSTVTIWGTPADPANDDMRCQGYFASAVTTLPPGCFGPAGTPTGPNPATLPERPFLTMPTRCTEPGAGLEATLRVSSYMGEPNFTDEATVEGTGIDGCEDVPFNPSVDFEPFNSTADRPTGAAVEVSLPEAGLANPDGIASAHLKRAEVALPEGMAINPSAAGGLAACSPEQIGLVSKDPVRFDLDDPRCPEASKIGSVRVETPVLDEDLTGDVFVAEQENNPFDSTFAMYVVAQSERHGVTVKLPGEITPDPDTGQITTTFDQNPQLPFSKLRVRLKGGDRAPLVNPPTCGTKTVEAELSPWSAADPDNPTADEIRTRTDSFQIDSGPGGLPCSATLPGRPFSPQMNAGVVNPVAGSFSPFGFQLKRRDGHQEVLATEVTPPEGVVASLRGIPLCTDAQADAGNCPAASRVGQAAAATGAGSSPYFVDTGEVFLTGPYKGAPLGLLIQVPAQAGPFDLGMVDVRAAVHVDPQTAQIRVVSDAIPRIIEGVPLRIRDIRVLMDREGFTLSPTDCDPKQVRAAAIGWHGGQAELAAPFQVAGCEALGFAPDFRFHAVGRQSTMPNRHPRITATVDAREGDANIGRVSVVLPRRMIVDQDNIATTCTRAQFASGRCPEETIMGSATAHSPLLDDPLHGPVYLIASGNPLPDLVADLKGIVDIQLFGRIHSAGIRVRNTFDTVPDVPIERFRLTVEGGPGGILVNGANLCRQARFRQVDVRVHGQSNQTAHQTRFLQSNRCLRQRARQLQQRIRNLRQRARQAASLGRGARANRLRAKAQRLQRQRQRVLAQL